VPVLPPASAVNVESLLSIDFEKRPLHLALRDIAEQQGINIIVDARVGEKALIPVTAAMDNVLVDTAVRLLADMADLKAVTVTNVIYVTTKANAQVMEKEQQKRRYKVMDGGQPRPPAAQ